MTGEIELWRQFWHKNTAQIVQQPLQRHFSVERARKCVLILETRNFSTQLPHMRAIVHQSLSHVPLDYAVLFLCCEHNYADVLQLIGLLNCNAKCRLLDAPINTVDDYNSLLLSSQFWQQFRHKCVLLLQEDSVLLEDGLQQFERYDFIGAAWPLSAHITPTGVGNGGLSLRNVDKLLEALQRVPTESIGVSKVVANNMQKRGLSLLPEDVYYATALQQVGGKVAPYSEAHRFAVESVFGDTDPLGYHQPWCSSSRGEKRWQLHIERALQRIPRQTFFFCHIEKCGGSSVRRIVHNAFRHEPDIVCFIPGQTCVSTAEPDADTHYDVYAYHCNYRRFVANSRQSSALLFCCTVLREPVSRLISHYHAFDAFKYANRRLDQLSATELSAYCDSVGHLMLRRLGTRYAADTMDVSKQPYTMQQLYRSACETLERMQLVGFVDNLSDFCAQLSAQTARTFQMIAPQNVAANKPQYSVQFCDKLREKVHWEQKFFQFARQKYSQ